MTRRCAHSRSSDPLPASRMHASRRLKCCLLLFFCWIPSFAFGDPTVFQKEFLCALNSARTDPQGFASSLEAMLPRFKGTFYLFDDGHMLRTQEGADAVEEAVRFLKKQKPLEPFIWSDGLGLAAAEHAQDQFRTGKEGHGSNDGSQPWDRANRHGRWIGSVGENIFYGEGSPRDVVAQWIIDDGTKDRGHRKNLFTPAFRKIGIGSAPHPLYGRVDVLDLAADFQEMR